MPELPFIRPLRARLLVDGSIEAEVAIAGVEMPVKLSIGRSERRMFRSGVEGQAIDLAAGAPAHRSRWNSPIAFSGTRL